MASNDVSPHLLCERCFFFLGGRSSRITNYASWFSLFKIVLFTITREVQGCSSVSLPVCKFRRVRVRWR